MHIATRRAIVAILTSLAVAATLSGCSSLGGPFGGGSPGGGSSGGGPSGGGAAAGQAAAGDSGLASALDLVPDMSRGSVTYTNWDVFGHRDGNGTGTASFAGQVVAYDGQLQRDLGIRSANAQWELDVWPARGAPLFVFGFDQRTDLAGLPGKLTRVGYHADGSVYTGSLSQARMWTLSMRYIGIDTRRHLLVGGTTAAAVRSVLAGQAHPLGRAGALTPLLALASARLGHIATAAANVGPMACVKLVSLIHVATPATVAALRKSFPGTFTPPQAEIIAMASPAGKTALDALTFPDQATAHANRTARSAAPAVFNPMAVSDRAEILVTGSTVTGRVLSFNLAAGQPHAFPERLAEDMLGVDICP